MVYNPSYRLNICNSIYKKYINEGKGIILPYSTIPFINIEEMREIENQYLTNTTVKIITSEND